MQNIILSSILSSILRTTRERMIRTLDLLKFLFYMIVAFFYVYYIYCISESEYNLKKLYTSLSDAFFEPPNGKY